jgi:hypothetical protein
MQTGFCGKGSKTALPDDTPVWFTFDPTGKGGEFKKEFQQ